MLNLSGWDCLVLGGGVLAESKVSGLLDAGARVTVVSPELTPVLAQLASEGRIRWLARSAKPADLSGFRLAISALEDRSSNSALAAEAERLGVLFNAVDDPANCRFLLPSVHRQGDLIIAVSTSGRCPALAVRIREQCARLFATPFAQFLELAGSLRARLAQRVPDFERRRRLWYELVDSPALEHFRRGEPELARAAVEDILAKAEQEVAHEPA
jgi:siroheme synthase-like protein